MASQVHIHIQFMADTMTKHLLSGTWPSLPQWTQFPGSPLPQQMKTPNELCRQHIKAFRGSSMVGVTPFNEKH